MTNPRNLFLGTGLLSFLIYLRTLAPTITWRNDGVDSGDLATAVAVGGVPHPPGYPTYLVLGELFKRLPVGDIAYRLNLLSAVCAALAVALVALAIRRTLSTTGRPPSEQGVGSGQGPALIGFSAASAALALAFSGTFWSQAVIAEVYALNVLFAAILLYGALQVRPTNQHWLAPGLAAVLGLGLGNHPSLLLVLPILIWLPKARWQWRLHVAVLLAFALGLAVYLVIPVRAANAAPVNWGGATTWSGFRWLVSAEPYRHFVFALPWEYVPGRVAVELRLLAGAFTWAGIPLALLGLRRLMQRYRSLAYGSLLTFLLVSMYAVGYNTTDSYVYLLPAWLIFALWLGWGLNDVAVACQRFIRLNPRPAKLIGWGLLLLPALTLVLNYPAQYLGQDEEAYRYAQRSLQDVVPGAVIVTDSDPHTFALWYARYGLGLRPDVAVVNSHLLAYDWYRQTLRQTHADLHLVDRAGRPVTTLPAFLEQNLPHSPIYLTSGQSSTLEGYRLEPVDHLQRVVELVDGK